MTFDDFELFLEKTRFLVICIASVRNNYARNQGLSSGSLILSSNLMGLHFLSTVERTVMCSDNTNCIWTASVSVRRRLAGTASQPASWAFMLMMLLSVFGDENHLGFAIL